MNISTEQWHKCEELPSQLEVQDKLLNAISYLSSIEADIFTETFEEYGVDKWNMDTLWNVIRSNDMEDIIILWHYNKYKAREDLDKQVKDMLKYKRQALYNEDPKRTFNRMMKDASPSAKLILKNCMNSSKRDGKVSNLTQFQVMAYSNSKSP
jgi:hypothetical protein